MKKSIDEEKLNKPQYGGTMNLRIDSDIVTFDPNDKSFRYSIMSGWLETLHAGYWPSGAGAIRPQIRPSELYKLPPGRKLGVYRTRHLCCSSAQGSTLAGYTAGKRP